MVLVIHLLKTKTELKNLFKQEIEIYSNAQSTKMIFIKLVSNMTWPMTNIKISLKEHNHTKF